MSKRLHLPITCFKFISINLWIIAYAIMKLFLFNYTVYLNKYMYVLQLQWLFGLLFMLPASPQTRSAVAPWHRAGGRALFSMAIVAALTGLMEKSTVLKLAPHQRESHLINFTGLAILLFGVFVELSVGLVWFTLGVLHCSNPYTWFIITNCIGLPIS